MSLDDRSPNGADAPASVDFDWASPRWREADDAQGDVERARRFRGDGAPRQRGAIDEDDSVRGSGESGGSSASGSADELHDVGDPPPG